MPLQGTFLADFESFYAAAQKAEVSLKGFETGAAKVETALNKMVDNFSGRKLIQEATLAAEAIERMGGVSKLTAAELETWGNKAEEAVEKIHALGERAEPSLLKLAAARKANTEATDQATKANDGWAASLSQVESVLQSLGIEIGGADKAIGALEQAAGRSGSALGALGTAGAAAGALFAGWEFGKWIDGWTGLSTIIGEAAARLLGWDAASAATAAKNDVLAKASFTAGVAVTDLAAAMKINEEAVRNQALVFDTAEKRVAAWRGEIEKLKSSGTFDQFKADLASAAFSLEELAKRYNVSDAAIQQFTKDTKAAADADQQFADRVHANNERLLKETQQQFEADRTKTDFENRVLRETTKLWGDYYTMRLEHGGTANEIEIGQINEWAANVKAKAHEAGTDTKEFYEALAANTREKMGAVGVEWDLWKTRSKDALRELANNALKTYNEMIVSGQFFRDDLDKQLAKYHELDDAARGYGDTSAAAQEKAAKAAEAHTAELAKQKQAIEAAADAERRRTMGNSITYDLSTEEGIDYYRKLNPAAAIGWSSDQIMNFIKKGGTLQQLIQMGIIRPYAGFAPGFASGVENFMGGLAIVGERGPELLNLPKGSDVIPMDRPGSGGAGGMTVTVNVSGILDPRTKGELGQIMNDAITRAILNGRKMGLA